MPCLLGNAGGGRPVGGGGGGRDQCGANRWSCSEVMTT